MCKRILECSRKEEKAKTDHYPDEDIEEKIKKKEDSSDSCETLEAICGGNRCYHICNALPSLVLVVPV